MRHLLAAFTTILILLAHLNGAISAPFDAGRAPETAPETAPSSGASSPKESAPSLQDRPDAAPGALESATTSTNKAQDASTPMDKAEEDPLGTASQMVKDIRSGNWRMVAASALALLMLLLMRFRDKIKWFGTDRGAASLVMLLSLGGGFSTSLAAGLPIDFSLVASIVGTAWMAAGGYHWFRSMFWPKDKAGENDPELIG